MINLGKIINNPLASKIGAIADFANYSLSAVNAFMVKPEIPEFTQQGSISGFLFDVKGRDELTLASNITDHYVENNSAMQDHIARKPITVRVNGFVGEVKNTFDVGTWQNTVATYAGKSTALSYLAPELTTQAKSVYNQMERLYGLYEKANDTVGDLYNQFKGTASDQTDTRQQAAFQYFKKAWETNQLFTVQTPWETLQQMVIESLRATQNDETKYVTEFEITFKQFRFASTLTRGLTEKEKEQLKSQKLSLQATNQQDKGTQNGTKKSNVSLAKQGARSLYNAITK